MPGNGRQNFLTAIRESESAKRMAPAPKIHDAFGIERAAATIAMMTAKYETTGPFILPSRGNNTMMSAPDATRTVAIAMTATPLGGAVCGSYNFV